MKGGTLLGEGEFQVVQQILFGIEIFVFGNLFAVFLAAFAKTGKENYQNLLISIMMCHQLPKHIFFILS